MLQLWLVANTVLWPFSVKLGGTSLNLNVVVLILATIAWLGKDWKIAVSSAKVLLALLVYALLSTIVVLGGPCDDHLLKGLLTLPILMFLIIAGMEIGHRAGRSDWLRLQRTAQWVIMVTFLSFLVELLAPAWFPHQAGYRSEGKLSGLFSEPSHVAFSVFPCIAILLVSEDKKKRKRGIWAIVGLLVFSESSTLVAFIVAWVIYRLLIERKIRQTAMVALGISLLVGLGAMINFDRFILPTIQRISGVASSSDTINISSLVYVQGWQDAWFNIQRTHGLGLGLNMMGCGSLPSVSARRVLDLVTFGELNAEDGSFLFSKVVSECGIAGIIAYALVIWWWVHLERNLRWRGKDLAVPALTAQAALVFCFVASSFVRSSGYFSGGFLLLVTAMTAASGLQYSFPRNRSSQIIPPKEPLSESTNLG